MKNSKFLLNTIVVLIYITKIICGITSGAKKTYCIFALYYCYTIIHYL